MAVPDPYTHARHAKRCRDAALQGVVLSQQLVQVRKREVIYCARIRDAYTTPDGLDCWTVDAEIPEQCRLTVSCRNVRLCGDSGCFCTSATAAEAGQAERRTAAAQGAGALDFMGGASNTSQTAHG